MNYDLDFLRGMHGAPAEAADEIERLRAEVERLNEVLDVQAGIAALLREDRDRLRAALREIANYHGQALVPATRGVGDDGPWLAWWREIEELRRGDA